MKKFTLLSLLFIFFFECCVPFGNDNVGPSGDQTEQPSGGNGNSNEDPITQPNNQIWYTSTDGQIVNPRGTSDYGGVNIVSNTYEDGKGVITFNGDVTSIGLNAFQGAETLYSIIIPNSVTSISSYAFKDCTNLTIVDTQDITSLSIISNVFEGCVGLTEFRGKAASEDGRCLIFEGVLELFAPAGLTEYVVPEGVVVVRGFANCTNLTHVTLSDGVIHIGDFYGCSKLESINIPQSVTMIYDDTFSECSSLKEIIIPEGIVHIPRRLFYNCKSLEKVTIPESVTSIGQMAFGGCESLKSIYIPNNITLTDGDDSQIFYGCSGLERFEGNYASKDGRCLIIDGKLVGFASARVQQYEVPSEVTSIVSGVFNLCPTLNSLTIPASVQQVGLPIVRFCDNFEALYFLSGTPPTSMGPGTNLFDFSPIANNVRAAYVPNLEATYKFRDAFPDMAEYIFPRGAILNKIYYTSNTGEIIEPNNYGSLIVSNKYYDDGGVITFNQIIRDIQPQAFFATTLRTIVIPDSVEWIGHEAFWQCAWLTEIECRPITPPTIDGLSTFTITDSLDIFVDDEVYDDYASAYLWGTVWNAFLRSTYYY